MAAWRKRRVVEQRGRSSLSLEAEGHRGLPSFLAHEDPHSHVGLSSSQAPELYPGQVF